MPRLDLASIPAVSRSGYPAPFADVVQGRWYRRLGPVAGLTDFAASHVILKPGAWSAQRHWHEQEDELLVMIAGAAVLLDDAGRTPLAPGDIAAFPKDDGNGHCVINESEDDCAFLVVGQSVNSRAHYPDIDMRYEPGSGFVHKDGSPW